MTDEWKDGQHEVGPLGAVPLLGGDGEHTGAAADGLPLPEAQERRGSRSPDVGGDDQRDVVRGAPGPLEPCTIFGRTCTLPDCDRPCDDAKYWIDAVPAAPYDPHEGVLCCPCVDRLRAQNKASSDEWTKRTAEMTSDLDTLRALMAEAETLNRTDDGIARHGMSQYGRAALAVALQEADDARLELTAMRAQMAKERRMRLYAESKLTRANCLLRAAKEKPDA